MLSDSDREWLEIKFKELYDRCNTMNVAIASHVAAPCHEAQKDSVGKAVSVVGIIVAVVMSLLAFLKSHLGGIQK